jgi:hypothetical protein
MDGLICTDIAAVLAERIYYIKGRSRSRSTPKTISTNPPRTSAKSQTDPHHPPSDFFFLGLFFSTFLGVSRQGEFKNTTKMFLQEVHVENFPQNFDKRARLSCSPPQPQGPSRPGLVRRVLSPPVQLNISKEVVFRGRAGRWFRV